jgi:regulator of sigma E protease
MNTVLLSIFAFLFAIGVLVAIHEWGHYIVARMAGVKVLRFSIGFGKPIWARRAGPDGTEYCLAAIPLGGYVKLLDEREGDVSADELPRAFNRQPILARIAILVAGPLMNFIFAIIAYWAMFIVGVPGMQPIIGEVDPVSIAGEAGLQNGDRIIAVSEQPVSTWEGTILAMLDSMLSTERVSLAVLGKNDRERLVVLDVTGRLSELTEPGALFTGLGLRPWSPTLQPVLGELTPDGSAQASGLLAGDLILSADGYAITDWSGWVEFVRDRPEQTVDIVIERGGEELPLALMIGEAALEDGTRVGRIGAGPFVPEGFFELYRAEQRYGALPAVSVAIARTWSMSALTVRMVGSMLTGDVSVKNISGPINIAQYAGYAASIGFASFLNFLAVVSLSLGILNLLPIPVLDGGQIVYQVAEAIKGQPLSERAQLVGQQIGVVFLVLVMSLAFYNDLSRLFY